VEPPEPSPDHRTEDLTMSTTATLTALKAAEAGLARAMESAAAELDAVGKGTLDLALARLQAAAAAARSRLAGTLTQMRAAVASVTAELEAAATDIWEDLSTEAFVPPAVWAEAATTPPAIEKTTGSPIGEPASDQPPAEAPTSSPDGAGQVEQPADLPVRSCHVAQETRSPAEAALGPAEAEPAFHGDATNEHAGELVTAAACPPALARHDEHKPADRPRGKRRRKTS
jgi:hypothetical protein